MLNLDRRKTLGILGLGIIGVSQVDLLQGLTMEYRDSENDLWDAKKRTATSALDFWVDLLKLQEGSTNNVALSNDYKSHWLCLIRAVSWVESKHGTVGANEPSRDPMQSGNPKDSWWKSLTHQSEDSDRFIGGPSANNYWAHELPAAAALKSNFPANAKLSKLSDVKKGHTDTAFNEELSYYWGIVYLIQRVNTRLTNGKTYKCGTYSKSYLVEGATGYNGGGDPNYQTKLKKALGGEVGCSLL